MSSTASARKTPFATVLSSLVIVELFSGVLQVYFTPLYAALGKKYDVSIGTLSWALTAFTLAAVVFTPLLARLGDLYGHRKILKIEVAIVAIGSVLVAVAPDFGTLVVGRVLQGSLAAYLPLMFGLIREKFRDDDLRRGVAYLTSVLIFGVVVGLVAIGAIVDVTSDPTWALWLPALGTAVGFGLLWLVPNETADPAEPGVRPSNKHVDWPGVLLLAGGLVAVLLALTEGSTWGWGSLRTVGLIALGVIVLAGWVLVELRTAEPLTDVRYLFRPNLAPVFAIGFFIYFSAIGSQVAVATLLELPGHLLGYGFSLTPWHFSLYYALVYFFTFLAAASTARSGRVFGFKETIVAGCVLVAVGYGGLIFVDRTLTGFLVFLAIAGAGAGFIEGSTRTVIVDSLREGEVAMGEGVYELAITVGGTVGAAVLGGVLSANAVKGQAFATLHGYRTAFVIMGVVGLLAAVVALAYLVKGRSGQNRSAGPSAIVARPDGTGPAVNVTNVGATSATEQRPQS
jgi:MFS family permease